MYLNHKAILRCVHGGEVELIPPALRSLNVMGSPVVTDVDLLEAVIVGCPQIGIGIKPCTKIISILIGRAVEINADGQTPILDSLQAMTDGSPPGFVSAITNGQSNATPISPQAQALARAANSGAAFCDVCRGTTPS